jgi:hypothetical protein
MKYLLMFAALATPTAPLQSYEQLETECQSGVNVSKCQKILLESREVGNIYQDITDRFVENAYYQQLDLRTSTLVEGSISMMNSLLRGEPGYKPTPLTSTCPEDKRDFLLYLNDKGNQLKPLEAELENILPLLKKYDHFQNQKKKVHNHVAKLIVSTKKIVCP